MAKKRFRSNPAAGDHIFRQVAKSKLQQKYCQIMSPSSSLIEDFHAAIRKGNAKLVDSILEARRKEGEDRVQELLRAFSDFEKIDIEIDSVDEECYSDDEELFTDAEFYNEYYGINGQTAMHLAVKAENSKDIIQTLVRNGADLNIRNTHGETPMYIAFHNNKSDIVWFLIQIGADTECKMNANGETALNLAVKKGFHDGQDRQIVSTLTKRGAAISHPTKDLSPLYNCVMLERTEMVSTLLQYGKIDMDHDASNYVRAFHHAALYGDFEVVRGMFEKELVTVDSVDQNGNTALHHACSWPEKFLAGGMTRKKFEKIASGKEQCISYLLESFGPEPINYKGERPLHWAIGVYRNNTDKIFIRGIETLLAAGCSVNAKDFYGRTPLLMAIKKMKIIKTVSYRHSHAGVSPSIPENLEKAVKLLGAHGALDGIASNSRMTPSMYALKVHSYTAFKWIIDSCKVDFHLLDCNGESLLHQICRKYPEGIDDEIESLLIENCNLGDKTKDKGETALMLAIKTCLALWGSRWSQLIAFIEKMVIACRRDQHSLDASNRRGRSAFHYVTLYPTKAGSIMIENRSKPLLDILLKHGSNIDVADNRGNTPLHLASADRSMQWFLVKELINRKADCRLKNHFGSTALDLVLGSRHDSKSKRVLCSIFFTDVFTMTERLLDAGATTDESTIVRAATIDANWDERHKRFWDKERRTTICSTVFMIVRHKVTSTGVLVHPNPSKTSLPDATTEGEGGRLTKRSKK